MGSVSPRLSRCFTDNLVVQQFGVVFPEDCLKGWSAAVRCGMDGFDQAEDVGCHDEEISDWAGSRIPVRVGCVAWHMDA